MKRRRRRANAMLIIVILVFSVVLFGVLINAIISVGDSTPDNIVPVSMTEQITENLPENKAEILNTIMPTRTPIEYKEISAPHPGWVNLRAENSDKSESIGLVVSGELVQVLDYDNGWFFVITEEIKGGWVFGRYIKK